MAISIYLKTMAGRLRTVCAARLPLLLLLALPAAGQAQYIYTTNNGAIIFRGYTGSGGVVSIPSTINGLPVTSIGAYAFFNQSSLTSVTIPNSVTSIGDSAFSRCNGLTNVTIPNTVTNIGDFAFSGCASLTSVTIPNSVTNIGELVFSYCTSLTAITVEALNSSFSSVDGVLFDKSQTKLIRYPGGKTGSYTIPNSVTNIVNFAFSSCNNLASVTIPNSVTNIGELVFSYCTSLTAITVEALNSSFSSLDGVLFDKSQTKLIKYPDGKAGSYTIPGSVTSIGYAALSSCTSLTSVTIPNSVTNIGNIAFASCTNLTSVTIPKSVTSIGDSAFSACTSLTAITVDALNSSFSSVDGLLLDKSQSLLIQYPGGKTGSYTIPNSVTSIGDLAFAYCTSLTSVTIPNSVTNIGDSAFSRCNGLTNVTIGNGVTSIGYAAFANCASLTAITVDALNSSFSSANGILFDKRQTTLIQYPGGKAGSYTIPNSVTNIGGVPFSGCISLTSVTIPNSVASIGGGAFYYCTTLTNVTIGNGVTTIGDAAFYYCTSLTNVTIPKSVTTIRDSAFYYCTNLTGVYFKGNAPSADSSVFPNDNNAIVYYLPGTMGWGPTFGGRPAVLWNPQVQTSNASFGVQANQFGFTITGTSSLVIVVEGCTNLANPAWSPVGTNTLIDGSSYFSDPQWTNYSNRFYRLRSP